MGCCNSAPNQNDGPTVHEDATPYTVPAESSSGGHSSSPPNYSQVHGKTYARKSEDITQPPSAVAPREDERNGVPYAVAPDDQQGQGYAAT